MPEFLSVHKTSYRALQEKPRRYRAWKNPFIRAVKAICRDVEELQVSSFQKYTMLYVVTLR